MLSNSDIFTRFKCTLYKMELPINGVFMPIAVARFSLAEEIHQLVQLPSIVEALYYVKVLIVKK